MQLWLPFLALIVTALAICLMGKIVRPGISGFPPLRRCILDGLLGGGLYGGWLALSGAPVLAACLTVALGACLAVGSNIKLSILGEPMLFCDVVAARGFLQNPKFYLFSIPVPGRIALVAGMIALPLLLAVCFSLHLLPHLAGIACLLACAVGLRAIPAARWAPVPDMPRDIGRLGLPGSLFLYWRRWRSELAHLPDGGTATQGMPRTPTGHAAYDIVIVVQCESFAVPTELFSGRPAPVQLPDLPNLKRAQDMASDWGTLNVSGFGAYTMRTEYGVLFGQQEEALGFRAYDPFLSADRDTAFSLPAIMGQAGYDCIFAHPHDLQFYGRARLMPACGFTRIIGEEAFTHTPRPDMPYIEDIALARQIGQQVHDSTKPTFIYAVTMENHGPWPTSAPDGPKAALGHYLRHLRNSDRMLGELMDTLATSGRSGLLVFFGDHRPSIPGMVMPGDARGTPYAVVPFSARAGQQSSPGAQRVRPSPLTPAQLHHLILRDSINKASA